LAEKFDEYERALKKIPQVKISGSGRVSEDEIVISGSGRILSDVEVKSIKVSGSASIDGKVKASQINISGSALFNDEVESNEIKISGSARFASNVKSKFMRISGSCSINGNLIVNEYLKSSGSIKVDRHINSNGAIEIYGSIKTNGDIKSKIFYAKLNGISEVKGNIEADDIEIHGKSEERGLVIFGVTIFGFKGKASRLYVSNIYAKNRVYIENVTCNNIEGSIVEIGRGCEVKGKVKYKREVKVHEKAKLASQPEKID